MDYFIETFAKIVDKLRTMSPMWDEFERGVIDSVIAPTGRGNHSANTLPRCPARRRIDLDRLSNQTRSMKKELVFEIEQEDGVFVAVCHEPEMATQSDSLGELAAMVRDLVKCRFEEGDEHLVWPIRSTLCAIPFWLMRRRETATRPVRK